MKMHLFVLALFVGTASTADAEIVTVTGDTTGGPTFNRPLADLTGLSTIGTATAYSTLTFSASVSGEYTFLTTGDQFDTFVILYSSFDPASPLDNAIVANDDLVSVTTSGVAATLVADSEYTYVVTGFANTDFGEFSTTIGGPGVITIVPEPTGLAFAAVALAAAAGRRRRAA